MGKWIWGNGDGGNRIWEKWGWRNGDGVIGMREWG